MKIRTLRNKLSCMPKEWKFEYVATPMGVGSAEDVFECEVSKEEFDSKMRADPYSIEGQEIKFNKRYVAVWREDDRYRSS